MRRLASIGAALAVAALAACAGPPRVPGCAAPAAREPVIELIFGRGLPGGGTVSGSAWQSFVDEELTPRFPDGLTVIDGAGQWRDHAAVLREKAKLVLIVPPPGGEFEVRLAAVIDAYKRRFRQQAVLRIDRTACVSIR